MYVHMYANDIISASVKSIASVDYLGLCMYVYVHTPHVLVTYRVHNHQIFQLDY